MIEARRPGSGEKIVPLVGRPVDLSQKVKKAGHSARMEGSNLDKLQVEKGRL